MTASTDISDPSGPGRRADQEDPESAQERRNRNWADILQELRVAQTGVQLLTAFLLALPFQNRFADLTDGQEWLYLAIVLLSITATGLLIMPVSLHRALFRRREKETLVQIANRLAQVGLAVLALAISGVVLLIFDVTKGRTTAAVAASATLVVLAVLWAAIPALITRSGTED
ncbi:MULTISPECIES: DUF6328 family protein [Frankia]|uniref:Integral membrane protein n=2 Tax=Frankia TaxID=1854 RepID=Q0RKL7_FRAAA|nr:MULTISPECIES: DUF6328 family protein [Frankia]CAJ61940.1 hypothetical protein; putative membrane protein [Frankia alni ACN14a]